MNDQAVVMRGGNSEAASMRQNTKVMPGDWICGKCGNNNFAKRMFCNIPTCRAPKDESAIIVPGEQRGGFGNDQGGFDYNGGGGGTEGNFGYGGANFGKSGAGPPPPSQPQQVTDASSNSAIPILLPITSGPPGSVGGGEIGGFGYGGQASSSDSGTNAPTIYGKNGSNAAAAAAAAAADGEIRVGNTDNSYMPPAYQQQEDKALASAADFYEDSSLQTWKSNDSAFGYGGSNEAEATSRPPHSPGGLYGGARIEGGRISATGGKFWAAKK